MVHIDKSGNITEKGSFDPVQFLKNLFFFIIMFFQTMMSPILNLTGVNSQNGGSSLFRGSSGSSGSGGGSGNRRRRNVINELPPVSDMSNTPCSSGGCCGG